MKTLFIFKLMQRPYRHMLLLCLLSLLPLQTQVQAETNTTADAPVLSRIAASGKVVIAHRESSIPFSYLDENKKPIGYAMDLCARFVKLLEKELKKPIKTEYVMVTSATRIENIVQGKADLNCESTTNNAERRQKVAFTVPHYLAGARLLVRTDSKVQRLEDLAGMTLVSTKSTTPYKFAAQQINTRALDIKLLEAPDHAKAVDMVEAGTADAFIMDDVLLYGLRASRAKPEALKTVGVYYTIEPLAIMFSKEDSKLKALIDAEMKRIILSGEINALYKRWFQEPIPPRNANLELPMSYLMRDFYKYPTDLVP